jgi:23S rRNA pseudouridine2605 synthase
VTPKFRETASAVLVNSPMPPDLLPLSLNSIFMAAGRNFSSRKSSGGGRGRSGGAKKTFGKGKPGDKKFSSSRPGSKAYSSKPYGKRDDRDEKPYSDRPKSFDQSDDRKKPYDKKFSSSRSKPFGKRDDRNEKPYGDRSKSFERSGEKRDFKKPFDKKFSSSRSKPFGKRNDRDGKPYGDRSKSFDRSDERNPDGHRDKKPYEKKFSSSRSKPFVKRDDRDEKPYGDRSKSFDRSDERNPDGHRDKKPYDKKFSSSRSKPFGKRDDRDEKPYGDRSKSFDRSDERNPDGHRDKKPYDKKFSSKLSSRGEKDNHNEKPEGDRSDSFQSREAASRRPFNKNFADGRAKPRRRDDNTPKPEERDEIFRPSDDGKDFVKHDERPKRRRKDDESSAEGAPKWNRKSGHEFFGDSKKPKRNDRDKPRAESYKTNDDGSIRLNKYISNSGICSRREADELIAAGVVSVNGEIMTELGYKVKPGDEVKYNNETLRTEKLVYILVNKPKDFITTVDDPQDRKTVMWLIKDACRERVYPVGRLDRNTTGVLLFTNDGDLAKKLTHPSFEVQKIYQVELDSPLKPSDMEQIKNGVTIEDGFIKVDDIAYSSVGEDKSVVGVEIHSGRNRIVRRIFEQFGYAVKKLDRVYFAGLSKKDLPRGRWRLLTPLEVSNLKMMTGNKKMQKYFEA